MHRATQRRVLVAVSWLVGAAGSLRAQQVSLATASRAATDCCSSDSGRAEGGLFAIVARAHGVLVVDPGTTISTVFSATSRAASEIAVTPRIEPPRGWSVVMGAQTFSIAPDAAETWVVSLAVPARMARGRYVVPVVAMNGRDLLARDSVVVEVRERHEVGVMLMSQPRFAVAGQPYQVRFLVQNRGNGPARVRLGATSARGAVPVLEALSLSLPADSSRVVSVEVATHAADESGSTAGGLGDDVVELRARDVGDSSANAAAAARVPLVPRPGAAPTLVTVPAQLQLRAARPGTGVAPFELTGAGRLRQSGTEQIEFTFRGPTDRSSPFGEHEEYRVRLAGSGYRVRVGDDLYGFSTLTSTGRMGFGAGAELSAANGALSAAAFGQRFRFERGEPGEAGVSLAATPSDLGPVSQVALSVVDRERDPLAGRIVGSSVVLRPAAGMRVDAEVAESDGPLGRGGATSLRLSGGGDAIPQYDVAHIAGGDAFAGAIRASSHDYLAVSSQPWHDLQLTAAASAHSSAVLAAPYRLRTRSVGLAHTAGLSISLDGADRWDEAAVPGVDGRQHGVTMRGQGALGSLRLWGTTEAGTMHDAVTERDRAFHALELGTATQIGEGSFSLFGQLYNGGSIIRGPMGIASLGGNADVRLARMLTLSLAGVGTMSRSTGGGYSQIDARLTRALRSGATISLRTRFTSGQATPATGRRLVFLEYGFPLRVPVGPVREPGRVHGRIVSAETGAGVAGALVRLGPQLAITDTEGRVSFTGLPAGEYRVSLAQNTSMANSTAEGEAMVRVDSMRREPATFRLAIARAARVEGLVRRMAPARTSVGNEEDSLVDVGPVSDVVLALSSGRDTIYRTTSEAGAFRFEDLAPRLWTLTVLSACDPQMRYEPATLDLALQPGSIVRTALRLVPRRREVHLIDEGDPPLLVPQAAPGAARTAPFPVAVPRTEAPRHQRLAPDDAARPASGAHGAEHDVDRRTRSRDLAPRVTGAAGTAALAPRSALRLASAVAPAPRPRAAVRTVRKVSRPRHVAWLPRLAAPRDVLALVARSCGRGCG